MKALIAGILGLFAVTANAGGIDCRWGVDHKHPACYASPAIVHIHHGHRHWNHHRHAPVIVHRHSNDWVAPMIGGVILGAVINEAADRRRENRVSPPNTPVTCTEWREIQQADGTIARERTCYQN